MDCKYNLVIVCLLRQTDMEQMTSIFLVAQLRVTKNFNEDTSWQRTNTEDNCYKGLTKDDNLGLCPYLYCLQRLNEDNKPYSCINFG